MVLDDDERADESDTVASDSDRLPLETTTSTNRYHSPSSLPSVPAEPVTNGVTNSRNC